TVEEVLRTGIQLASAVETAHRAGIVHRDIKPANVLVSQYGAPGLTDDPRFATNLDRVENRAPLREELERRLGLDSVEYWAEALNDAGVPAGPVNDIGGGFGLAGNLELDPVTEIEGTRTTSSPIRLSGSPPERRFPPPDLDQHGEEIREWLHAPREE
ncbi:MAG TPA: CoA transferase, partial [Solirubrobacterales bacterium]|nr:CoA transferase [Solirubrobacterales bacterium]